MKTLANFSHRSFSLMLIISLAAGLVFPTVSENLKPLNLLCLGLLIFFPTLKISIGDYWSVLRNRKNLVAISLVFLFFPIPILTYLIGRQVNLPSMILAGVVFSSASPCMLSVPYLSEAIGGDSRLAWCLTVTSTMIAPLVYVMGANLFFTNIQEIDIFWMGRTILLVLLIPIGAAILVRRSVPLLAKSLFTFESPLSQIAIVLLNWLFVSFNRQIILQLDFAVFCIIFLMGIFQSLGVFLLTRWFGQFWLSPAETISLAVSYSMKNSALIGGVMLLYDVRLALASSIFAFSNILMFMIIDKIKQDLATGRAATQ
jgi:predicted Na+-dependent transporter